VEKVTALVPMKGHSQRIPNKNLRPFFGRPLYHQILLTLLECPEVETIVINTDSDEIAREAAHSFQERVRILRRPADICGDFVSMNTIIQYDLSQVSGDFFLQTHSTNPLLKSSTLRKAMELFFKNEGYDSLFGVTRRQARFYTREGSPINHDPREMLRTQDLPSLYEENSNLYLFSRQSFQRTGRRIGERPFLFEIPKLEAIDIDDETDFKLAEYAHPMEGAR
jgi:N-acylneuraminate cytidylyltransferase